MDRTPRTAALNIVCRVTPVQGYAYLLRPTSHEVIYGRARQVDSSVAAHAGCGRISGRGDSRFSIRPWSHFP